MQGRSKRRTVAAFGALFLMQGVAIAGIPKGAKEAPLTFQSKDTPNWTVTTGETQLPRVLKTLWKSGVGAEIVGHHTSQNTDLPQEESATIRVVDAGEERGGKQKGFWSRLLKGRKYWLTMDFEQKGKEADRTTMNVRVRGLIARTFTRAKRINYLLKQPSMSKHGLRSEVTGRHMGGYAAPVDSKRVRSGKQHLVAQH